MKKRDTTYSNWSKLTRTVFQIFSLFLRGVAYCSLRLNERMAVYLLSKDLDLKNSKSMDSEQRYTEEANFDFEEGAYNKVLKLKSVGYYLSMAIHKNAHKIRIQNEMIQNYAVLVTGHGRDDTPFEIQVLRQDGDVPILIDVRGIDMDSYLEMINQNKSITHESKK